MRYLFFLVFLLYTLGCSAQTTEEFEKYFLLIRRDAIDGSDMKRSVQNYKSIHNLSDEEFANYISNYLDNLSPDAEYYSMKLESSITALSYLNPNYTRDILKDYFYNFTSEDKGLKRSIKHHALWSYLKNNNDPFDEIALYVLESMSPSFVDTVYNHWGKIIKSENAHKLEENLDIVKRDFLSKELNPESPYTKRVQKIKSKIKNE